MKTKRSLSLITLSASVAVNAKHVIDRMRRSPNVHALIHRKGCSMSSNLSMSNLTHDLRRFTSLLLVLLLSAPLCLPVFGQQGGDTSVAVPSRTAATANMAAATANMTSAAANSGTNTLVDFHEFAGISNPGVAVGDYYSSRGLILDSGWGSGYWDGSGATDPGIAYTEPNVIYNGVSGTASPIRGHFVIPNTTTDSTVSSLSVRSIWSDNTTVTSVTIYGLDGNVLDSEATSTYSIGGVNIHDFTFNTPGIHSFAVSFSNSTIDDVIGIDHVIFNSSTPQIEFDPTLPTSVRTTVRPRFNSGFGLYALTPSIQTYQKVVTVKDAGGNPLSGVDVRISISGDNTTAGHAAIANHVNVHGWLAFPGETPLDDNGVSIDTNVGFAIPLKALGGSQKPSGSISRLEFIRTTDLDGEVTFVYIPGEVAGVDTLKAELVDQPDVTPATAKIRVSVDNLVDMTTVNDFPFRLYGVTTSHPINWFAAQQTVTALRSATNKYLSDQLNDPQIVDAIGVLSQLGYDFRNEEPNGSYRGGIVVPKSPEILFINDISLPLGGLFDVDSDFASPHGGHRDGAQLDLDSKHLVGGNEPYKIVGGSWDYPPFTSAIGDPRLEQPGGSSPFTNADTFVGANKKIMNYSDSIRKRMNQQVKVIHYRRLQLLLDALAASGGTFARESNHIHVKF